jgi:hypothetical protein
MDPLERVMRIMTHVNIGAALGMVAWLAWSGAQVVTGQIAPARAAAPEPPAAVAPEATPATDRDCRCEPRWVV